MRICVFGAGSLGSALGGILAKRHEVHLVGRAPQVSAVRSGGLLLSGSVHSHVCAQAHLSVMDVPPVDLLIISTKAYDTREAVDACRGWASDTTKVLTLQNGLGNLDTIRSWKGSSAFGGTTSLGALLAGPGRVEISGLGRTVIGADMDPDGAREIVRMLAECGLPTEAKSDVMGEIWAKGVVNACINPVTAILRVPNGALLQSEAVTKLMGGICAECEAVAEACDVHLPGNDMFGKVRSVAEDTGRNRSSMLTDVELGRRTEIHEINGAFLGHGVERGVRVPLNKAMVAMVEALEATAAKKA